VAADKPIDPPRRRPVATALQAFRRRVPAARLLWILLAVLAAYGIDFLSTGIGLVPVLVLPVVAVLVDLGFQRIRFDALRFPDPAIATGLFLALLLPPVVPLAPAIATTIAAISLRHVLRYRGRPWFNPAALGVLVAALFFGVSPAWWGAISEMLVVAGGIALLIGSRGSWSIALAFLGVYAGMASLQRVIVSLGTGAIVSPRVLFLTALDPTVLFFGLFMVVEPRTAPTEPTVRFAYAVGVAAAAALLPLVFPTMALIIALLVVNFGVVVLRFLARHPIGAARAAGSPSRRSTPAPRRADPAAWSLGRRAGTGLALLFFLAIVAAATYSPATHTNAFVAPRAGGGGTAVSVSECQVDNGSISSSVLGSLHKTLGPSVILNYNPSNGVVVFFDPVNQVTVTETDLYEDYGFAEFNGDDYTSAGCVPP
jgi:Na+-translocating ferredoxin:NAD+ oxidoreductase RnfD subunit